MKIKALKAFGNGCTGCTYQATYTYDVTDAYGAELIAAGIAEDVTPAQIAVVTANVTNANANANVKVKANRKYQNDEAK